MAKGSLGKLFGKSKSKSKTKDKSKSKDRGVRRGYIRTIYGGSVGLFMGSKKEDSETNKPVVQPSPFKPTKIVPPTAREKDRSKSLKSFGLSGGQFDRSPISAKVETLRQYSIVVGQKLTTMEKNINITHSNVRQISDQMKKSQDEILKTYAANRAKAKVEEGKSEFWKPGDHNQRQQEYGSHAGKGSSEDEKIKRKDTLFDVKGIALTVAGFLLRHPALLAGGALAYEAYKTPSAGKAMEGTIDRLKGAKTKEEIGRARSDMNRQRQLAGASKPENAQKVTKFSETLSNKLAESGDEIGSIKAKLEADLRNAKNDSDSKNAVLNYYESLRKSGHIKSEADVQRYSAHTLKTRDTLTLRHAKPMMDGENIFLKKYYPKPIQKPRKYLSPWDKDFGKPEKPSEMHHLPNNTSSYTPWYQKFNFEQVDDGIDIKKGRMNLGAGGIGPGPSNVDPMVQFAGSNIGPKMGRHDQSMLAIKRREAYLQKENFIMYGHRPEGSIPPGTNRAIGMSPQSGMGASFGSSSMPSFTGGSSSGSVVGGSRRYVGVPGNPSQHPKVQYTENTGGTVDPGKQSEGAHRNLVNVPYVQNGKRVPASIRYNNPGAAYPRPRDNLFGLEGYGIIGGGHKIGKYPSIVHGLASNMDLTSKGYVGMTLRDATAKWRGRGGTPLPKGLGIGANDKITPEMVKDKTFMVQLFSEFSKHEAGRKNPITTEQFKQAFDMYQVGGIDKFKEKYPDFKPSELKTRTEKPEEEKSKVGGAQQHPSLKKLDDVNPMLKEGIIAGAKEAFGDPSDPNTRYEIRINNAVRSGGGRSKHNIGRAADLQIFDRKTGQFVGQDKTGTSDIMSNAYGNPHTYNMYQSLARGGYKHLTQKYGEEAANEFTWGGNFLAKQGTTGGAAKFGGLPYDQMHFSIGEHGRHGTIKRGAGPQIAGNLRKHGIEPAGPMGDPSKWVSPHKETLNNKNSSVSNEKPTVERADTPNITMRVNQNQARVAGIRKGALQPSLVTKLNYAANKVGVQVDVISGGQRMPGARGFTGTHEHDRGGAADFDLFIIDKKGNRVRLDQNNPEHAPTILKFTKEAARAGIRSAGADYMGSGSTRSSRFHMGISRKNPTAYLGRNTFKGAWRSGYNEFRKGEGPKNLDEYSTEAIRKRAEEGAKASRNVESPARSMRMEAQAEEKKIRSENLERMSSRAIEERESSRKEAEAIKAKRLDAMESPAHRIRSEAPEEENKKALESETENRETKTPDSGGSAAPKTYNTPSSFRNGPESEPPAPGDGGYGSYSRCFIALMGLMIISPAILDIISG